jgi:hypothetical protein
MFKLVAYPLTASRSTIPETNFGARENRTA